MINVPILPEDGWKEVSSEPSGLLTLTTGGQWCKSVGQPNALLVGHRMGKKPLNFKLEVGESLYVLVSRVCTALVGKGFSTECNFYTFKSTDTDSLQLGAPFTGNLKVLIKAPAETGLNPALIAGRQGAFIADTWMQYEIEAVAITNIVDQSFNGAIGRYAKNDEWFELNMGKPSVPPTEPVESGQWTMNGEWN